MAIAQINEANIGGREMSDVKWIKVTTDIFDDDKILLIEGLPEADSIIVIWFKLLCLAGKQNNSGVFLLNDRIPYTDKMLATIFRRKETTVQLALKTFEEFGMIEIVDNVITIPNWGKHQNLDQLESRKEYMREYMREYREKQRRLLESKECKVNSKVNGKVNVNSLEGEVDKEGEGDKEEEKEDAVISLVLNDKSEYPIYQDYIDQMQDLYPAVNVEGEFRKMSAWCINNPDKRKTKKGITRFINSWLSREQDKGGSGGRYKKGKSFLDMYREMCDEEEGNSSTIIAY